MELSQKNYLISKINQLSFRRNQHDKIIDKLVGNHSGSKNKATNLVNMVKNNHRTFLNVKQKQEVEAAKTNRSCISNSSSISKQVNLDMYMNMNATQKMSKIQPAQCRLEVSLRKIYGDEVMFQITPPQKMDKFDFLIENSVDFTVIATYFHQQGLWNQVFMQQDDGIYAFLFEEFDHHNRERICLSRDQIHESELQLIVKPEQHRKLKVSQNSDSNESREEWDGGSDASDFQPESEQQNFVNLGYLLLYRLMSAIGSGSAPHMLQVLFGFPYQTLDIYKTEDYLTLTNKIPKMNKKQNIVLGEKYLNSRLCQIPIQALKQTNASKLVGQYRKITIITTLSSVCAKNMKIVHRRNHHAVVDIENSQQNPIDIYVTLISKDEEQQQKSEQSTTYRYCLVSEDGELIQYSSQHHKNRQSFLIRIEPFTQYKLYTSQTSTCADACEAQHFSLVIHSQNSLQHLNMFTKFNESYNTLTQSLINRYLADNPNIDEVQLQMIRISHTQPLSDLIIVRAHLRFMGFAVDFVSMQQDSRANARRTIKIEYTDKQVFCDRSYKQNQRILSTSQSQIHQIYLSKKSSIKNCSGLTFAFSQIML